jgi:hypothetical protein
MKPIDHDHDNANTIRHEEWLMDEAIRGSFPASDPASSSQPGSIVNQRYARSSRANPVAALAVSLVLALPAANALAQDQAAYDQRSAARLMQQFAAQDRDHKGQVSRAEAQGNIDFIATFDDIDINRDGIVTRAELDRYLALQYGKASPSAAEQ